MTSTQLVKASDDLVDGKYQLVDPIGSGGVGTVYRAKHVWTQREVAVKVLHQNLPYLRELRSAFLREARATVQLRHPNVVDVLDMGEEDTGRTYLVMELLTGPTLREVLDSRGSLSPEETVVVLAPLIDALERAHGINIIHKDFKPENIILTPKRKGVVVPKLLDFGVAQILRDSSSSGADGPQDVVVGTPQYMSPEQARGEGDRIGPHSDVWGLGVVWYECLTGRCPFHGDSDAEILEAVGARSLSFGALPESHRSLVRGMLRRSIEERTPDLSFVRDQMAKAGIATEEQLGQEGSALFRLPTTSPRPSRSRATLQGVGPFSGKSSSAPRRRSADDYPVTVAPGPAGRSSSAPRRRRTNDRAAAILPASLGSTPKVLVVAFAVSLVVGLAALWGARSSEPTLKVDPRILDTPIEVNIPTNVETPRRVDLPTEARVKGSTPVIVSTEASEDTPSIDSKETNEAGSGSPTEAEASPDQSDQLVKAKEDNAERSATNAETQKSKPESRAQKPVRRKRAKQKKPVRDSKPKRPSALPGLVTEW